MANNLHISYDLHTPGQGYERLAERIKALGSWAKVHMSFWYVNSNYSAAEAVEFLQPAIDDNDKIYVVDASNNTAAWNHLPNNVADHVKENWVR